MPYQANVFKVMIASPGDVQDERAAIRAAIHEWNSIHSEERQIVLMPVGWETHSYPLMGDRPQAIINSQILQNCDLLVAVFWTRLGTDTGEAPSGTVEEIEKHMESGKPTMLYFSGAPVLPDSLDQKQYKALKKFQNECQNAGLYEQYFSLEEFRNKFPRQLGQIINTHACFQRSEPTSTEVAAENAPRLSVRAEALLREAVEDPFGAVIMPKFIGGMDVETNNKSMLTQKGPREEAAWEAAVNELCQFGMLLPENPEHNVFKVTNLAYEFADTLK